MRLTNRPPGLEPWRERLAVMLTWFSVVRPPSVVTLMPPVSVPTPPRTTTLRRLTSPPLLISTALPALPLGVTQRSKRTRSISSRLVLLTLPRRQAPLPPAGAVKLRSLTLTVLLLLPTGRSSRSALPPVAPRIQVPPAPRFLSLQLLPSPVQPPEISTMRPLMFWSKLMRKPSLPAAGV